MYLKCTFTSQFHYEDTFVFLLEHLCSPQGECVAPFEKHFLKRPNGPDWLTTWVSASFMRSAGNCPAEEFYDEQSVCAPPGGLCARSKSMQQNLGFIKLDPDDKIRKMHNLLGSFGVSIQASPRISVVGIPDPFAKSNHCFQIVYHSLATNTIFYQISSPKNSAQQKPTQSLAWIEKKTQ